MTRLALLFASLFLAGCAVAPLTGPQTYQDGSMSFSVPANWKVTMHGEAGGCGHAFVEAPGEAVAFIKGVPLKNDPGIAKYARTFSRTADSRIPVGKITGKRFSSFQDKRYGPAIKEAFTITFQGTQVPHTRTYYRREGSHCAFYLLTQVADEDASEVSGGFSQILNSFAAR
jgi:hypothetical protein